MSNIPKLIHYCWFGGEKPQNVIDCINNWKEKLPYYEIVEINDKNKELFDVEKECQNNLWFKTVYENKLWAYVADYARLKVLHEKGGIYFDTDITIEKDLTDLVEKNKLILAWEDDKSIANGVIITCSKSKIIKEILNFYNEKIWNSELCTIPQITTDIIKKHYKLNSSTEITENDDILILPPEYFYPIPFTAQDRKKEDCVTKNTYTIHWWAESWTKPNINYFLKNKHRTNLQKLIKKCFMPITIFSNKFLTISKLFKKISIDIDFYYLFRFKSKFKNNHKYLTIFILGIQIPLWRIK